MQFQLGLIQKKRLLIRWALYLFLKRRSSLHVVFVKCLKLTYNRGEEFQVTQLKMRFFLDTQNHRVDLKFCFVQDFFYPCPPLQQKIEKQKNITFVRVSKTNHDEYKINHFFTDSLLFSILFHHFSEKRLLQHVAYFFFFFFRDWSLMTCGNSSSSTTFTYVHTFQLIIVDFSLEKYNQKDDDQKDDDDDYFCSKSSSSSRWILWFLFLCSVHSHISNCYYYTRIMIAIGYVSFWLAFDSYKELKKHKKMKWIGRREDWKTVLRMEEVYSVWAGRVASKKIFQGEFMYVYEKKKWWRRSRRKKSTGF